MWRGIAAQAVLSPNAYRGLLERTGFRILAIEDLTEAWDTILARHVALYERVALRSRRALLRGQHANR